MPCKTCDYCAREVNDEGESDLIRDAMLGNMHPACRGKFIAAMKNEKGI